VNVDAAVYARLSGFAGLVALTTRIRPVSAAPGDAYPYVVYSVISDLPYPAMSADAAPHRARVQVSSFDNDFNSMRAVDAQVRLALSRFRGTAGSVGVQDVIEDGVQDLHDEEVGENGVFQRARDFIVFYEV